MTTSWKPGKRVEMLYKTPGDNTKGKRFGYVINVNTTGGMHLFDKSRTSQPGEAAFLVARTPDGRTGAIWYSFEGIRFTQPPKDLIDQLSEAERVALDLDLEGSNGKRIEELVPSAARRGVVKTAADALRTLRSRSRVHSTMSKADVTAFLKQLRAEIKRIGADVKVGRIGTGKYQEIALTGSDAEAVARQLEARGYRRTALSGSGLGLMPITLVKA